MQYKEINQKITLFSLMVFDEEAEKTWASLVLHDVGSYQQAIFEARSDEGYDGSGYDWQELAQAFLEAKRPELKPELSFDSESSLFCVRSENLPALADFAQAFWEACQDVEAMSNLLSPASPQDLDEPELELATAPCPAGKQRIPLAEGDIFLLTPPLESDPTYACRLVYLSYEIKGLCAYVLSSQPVDEADLDLDAIAYDYAHVIYASIHFMKRGLWKKLAHHPLTDQEDKLAIRHVGSYRIMDKDQKTDLVAKEHRDTYPLQPVYDLIEVFALIYGKHYKKKDPRYLAWAQGEIEGRLT